MAKLLGIDFGLKRTGIAITDDLGILAVPHTFVASIQLMSYLIEVIPKFMLKVGFTSTFTLPIFTFPSY